MTSQSTPIIKQFVSLVEVANLDNSVSFVEGLADELISDLDLILVKKISHKFSPSGTTLVYLLSQSHLAIHTWPEVRLVHIDLVICVNRTVKEYEKALKLAFSEQEILEVKTLDTHYFS